MQKAQLEGIRELVCSVFYPGDKRIIGTTSQSFFEAKKSLETLSNRFSKQKNHWEHLPIIFRGKKIIGSTSQSFFEAKESLGASPNHFSK